MAYFDFRKLNLA